MRPTWAVGRNLIREVLRMRFLMAFVVLMTAADTFGLALWLHGSSGLAHEKIQTFLGYSFRLTTWFLSLMTIFVAIATIAGDIKNKEIFTVATKPISRGRFLIGKFLGLALLNLMLLTITTVLIGTLARIMQRTEPTTADERARLGELVLVARVGVEPPKSDLRKEAELVFQQRIKDRHVTDPQEIARLRSEMIDPITANLVRQLRAVGPRGTKTWRFSGIAPADRAAGYVYLRYKHDPSVNPDDLKVKSEWWYGPAEPLRYGGVTHDSIRTMHELPIPVTELSAAGDLYVRFRNITDEPITVVFPPDRGLELLYVAGGFEANLLRTAGLLYVRLLFLTLLALAAGAWVSFPVAVLLVLVIYFLGLASDFILESINFETAPTHAAAVRVFMIFFPKLASYDPIGLIEKGRLVSFALVRDGLFSLLLIKGGIAAFIGYLIFKFRELGRVVV